MSKSKVSGGGFLDSELCPTSQEVGPKRQDLSPKPWGCRFDFDSGMTPALRGFPPLRPNSDEAFRDELWNLLHRYWFDDLTTEDVDEIFDHIRLRRDRHAQSGK